MAAEAADYQAEAGAGGVVGTGEVIEVSQSSAVVGVSQLDL